MTETVRIVPGGGEAELEALITKACELMDEAYGLGYYSKITVTRSWSKHNPTISGKAARPSA